MSHRFARISARAVLLFALAIALVVWLCAGALAANPVAYYSFDTGTYQTSAGTVDDVANGDIGNNQIRQIGSGVTMGVDGIAGQSAYFNGRYYGSSSGGADNAFLKAPASTLAGPGLDSLYGMNALSITVWVKPTKMGFINPLGTARDVVRIDNSVFGDPIYSVAFAGLSPTSISLCFTVCPEGTTYETILGQPLPGNPDDVFFDDRWHMIGCVYDGQYMRMYWDGQQLGNPRACSGPVRSSVSGHALEIGNFPFAESWEPFRGGIDEVKIYNVALSAGEIAQEYSAVPEPASAVFISTGLLGLLGMRRRRQS